MNFYLLRIVILKLWSAMLNFTLLLTNIYLAIFFSFLTDYSDSKCTYLQKHT